MKALVKCRAERGLWLESIEEPAIGINDVLIRVRYTGICGTDVHIYQWDEWARQTIPLPMAIGHEFVGEIVEVGSNVNDFHPGDIVSGEGHVTCGRCRNCLAGRRHLCAHTSGVGVDRPGAFAEFIALPMTNIWRHESDVDQTVAAIFDPFGNAVHTALSFPTLGEDVLITGAGPIGIMAIPVIRHAGARHVVITDVNPFRLKLAREMGATLAINPLETPLAKVQGQLKMCEGFDVGLEMSGNPMALRDMIANMSHGGKIAMLGIPVQEMPIDWRQVIFNMLTLKGIYGREMYETWYKMSVMIESGLDISRVITHRFSYQDFHQGFDAMVSGQTGKVILIGHRFHEKTMNTSLFDIFKIGIGPSSSHTVGPMRAAKRFVLELATEKLLKKTICVSCELYGSLALTGLGHATDHAVLLGLCGQEPGTVDPSVIGDLITTIRTSGSLPLLGIRTIAFFESVDLIFHRDQTLPFHPNGMRFTAFGVGGAVLKTCVYYSIGGGFIVAEGEEETRDRQMSVSYPFRSASELLGLAADNGLAIWQLMLANECDLREEAEVRAGIERIWQAMQACTTRGMMTEGVLPGGLKVRRRALRLAERLKARASNPENNADPLAPLDWVTVYAMAVNEENAAGGRVVTAPTNGAAGVVPAVAHYYTKHVPDSDYEGILRYFLTAAAIGILYKENASISGAEVGCQGEVGVACSMAAGGLVAALGGTNAQIEHAAEVGMEHNLGMTCDPIGGLVQIPCIERNAMGAIKAINACRLAMNETEGHKISLDQVIETMYRTGLDMQSRYKETSLAGLALNIIEC